MWFHTDPLPRAGARPELRDLGAHNSICNLTHAADDGARVRHEARVLFGDDRTKDEESMRDLAIIANRPACPVPLWPAVTAGPEVRSSGRDKGNKQRSGGAFNMAEHVEALGRGEQSVLRALRT